jgi:hypothetical protein
LSERLFFLFYTSISIIIKEIIFFDPEKFEADQHIACQHRGRVKEMSVYSERERFYHF